SSVSSWTTSTCTQSAWASSTPSGVVPTTRVSTAVTAPRSRRRSSSTAFACTNALASPIMPRCSANRSGAVATSSSQRSTCRCSVAGSPTRKRAARSSRAVARPAATWLAWVSVSVGSAKRGLRSSSWRAATAPPTATRVRASVSATVRCARVRPTRHPLLSVGRGREAPWSPPSLPHARGVCIRPGSDSRGPHVGRKLESAARSGWGCGREAMSRRAGSAGHLGGAGRPRGALGCGDLLAPLLGDELRRGEVGEVRRGDGGLVDAGLDVVHAERAGELLVVADRGDLEGDHACGVLPLVDHAHREAAPAGRDDELEDLLDLVPGDDLAPTPARGRHEPRVVERAVGEREDHRLPTEDHVGLDVAAVVLRDRAHAA